MEQSNRVIVAGLAVRSALHEFIEREALPGSGVTSEAFWAGFAAIVRDLTPRNRGLLLERDRLQLAIDDWHRSRADRAHDAAEYRRFLTEISYLVPEGPPFRITTASVDPEVALIAGPQLVVPLSNARYALNAVNARWGSLYNALYGTDALGTAAPSGGYDRARGALVIAWTRRFLDDVVPLGSASHSDVTRYFISDGALVAATEGGEATLIDSSAFVGFEGPPESPSALLLQHHDLHVEVRLDRHHRIGQTDRAGVADVVLEAAVTAVMDCEDSVAAVDAEDKVLVYRNWLGLMRGDLTAAVPGTDGHTSTRRLAQDRTFRSPDGSTYHVPGRAVLFVRNVGHLMTTDAVLDSDGAEIPEGFLDAAVTVLAATHDLRKARPMNSRARAVYVVKPKMHGPDECRLADALFERVELMLGLSKNTVKLGLMDEERRTSANLAECIRSIAHRIVFINTGFLDRTGDEIHTSMQAGAMVPKAAMKDTAWL
ncbi:MAG: malate synthase G, partial [Actinomycetota bacterium]